MAQSRTVTWIAATIAGLVLLPLLAMIVMMTAGGSMMAGMMGTPMMKWALVCMILAAVLLVATLLVILRSARSPG